MSIVRSVGYAIASAIPVGANAAPPYPVRPGIHRNAAVFGEPALSQASFVPSTGRSRFRSSVSYASRATPPVRWPHGYGPRVAGIANAGDVPNANGDVPNVKFKLERGKSSNFFATTILVLRHPVGF